MRPAYRGNVQRVVDGETYHFEGWQGLTDMLDSMLMGTKPTACSSPPEAENLQDFRETHKGEQS